MPDQTPDGSRRGRPDPLTVAREAAVDDLARGLYRWTVGANGIEWNDQAPGYDTYLRAAARLLEQVEPYIRARVADAGRPRPNDPARGLVVHYTPPPPRIVPVPVDPRTGRPHRA